MTRNETVLSPVEKTVEVPGDPATVFRRFTREMGQWWPLGQFSIGGADAVEVVFEERVGGRVFERVRTGEEHAWGTVLVWEPPDRLVMSWHPGRPESTAQELEVRFSAAGAGRSRVELVHRGWERLGSEAAKTRDQYDPGWDAVLDGFTLTTQ